MEYMIWRLGRFVEKKERAGEIMISPMERELFLREFEKHPRYKGVTASITKRIGQKRLIHRIGQFADSLLYGQRKKRANLVYI